jgi:hypothetical protein
MNISTIAFLALGRFRLRTVLGKWTLRSRKRRDRGLAPVGLLCLSMLSAGCAPYTQVQMTLVEQARRGVAQVAQAAQAHEDAAEQLYTAKRQRLDEAFDADVREREAREGTVGADWVIEHRRAYAAGVDAMERQRAAAQAASEVTRRNLRAVDDALQRLAWLQSLELQWASLWRPSAEEEKP